MSIATSKNKIISPMILAPLNPPNEAMQCVLKARELAAMDNREEAVGYLMHAMAIVHRFPHAMLDLKIYSEDYYKAGVWAIKTKNREHAIWFLVTAIEIDPDNTKAKQLLKELDESHQRPDTTRTCYVFYDQKRANDIHREAIRRSLEFTSIAGVIGDVMEFGVLAGWSARIIAETMRDVVVMGNLHLFDSFDGLPEYDSKVDQESFEISGRNVWSDKMRFPDDFVASIGGSIENQIHTNLSYIIRKERTHIHRGFYSESLKKTIGAKAALVHIDCDLYQSTVEVLWGLYEQNVFQDGCVLLFDDWNCNKANPNFGERKAFKEFLNDQNKYTASDFFTYGFNGAAFILHE